MDRRLYISDLDGTLLLPDRTLGARTRDTLQRFICRGGRFTLATGRSAASAAACMSGITLPVDAIVHNGAQIVDLSTAEISHAVTMNGTLTRDLFGRAVGLGLCPMVYAMDPRGTVSIFVGGEGNAPTRRYLSSLESLHPIEQDNGQRLGQARGLAMILLDDPALIDRFFEEQCIPDPVVTLHPGRSVYASGLGVGEVTAAGATKARAAERLARCLGLTMDDVVAFGDNYNDLGLLLAAGEAYCTPDAPEEIRAQIAGRIGSTSEQGVATHLESVIQ
jgi:Cof subfamily protein (haloacid dehalogenase superfamily)